MNPDDLDDVAKPGPNHVMTESGRPSFAPGNAVARLGGKAPKRAVEYRKAIEAAETVEDVAKALAHMRKLFMEQNDVAAGKVYLAYTLGQPHRTVEVTGDVNTTSTTRSWTMADLLALMKLKAESDKGSPPNAQHP